LFAIKTTTQNRRCKKGKQSRRRSRKKNHVPNFEGVAEKMSEFKFPASIEPATSQLHVVASAIFGSVIV
jgi:hypothetical protein